MKEKQTMTSLHLAICVIGNTSSELWISDQITKTIKSVLGIDKTDLEGKNRKREIVLGRHFWRHLLRKYLPVEKNTLNAVGYLTGNADHATVIHSLRQVNNLLDCTDDFSLAYSEKYANIESKVKEVLRFQTQL